MKKKIMIISSLLFIILSIVIIILVQVYATDGKQNITNDEEEILENIYITDILDEEGISYQESGGYTSYLGNYTLDEEPTKIGADYQWTNDEHSKKIIFKRSSDGAFVLYNTGQATAQIESISVETNNPTEVTEWIISDGFNTPVYIIFNKQ